MVHPTDGWMGGWMDGWMDGWVVGWMDGYQAIRSMPWLLAFAFARHMEFYLSNCE